MIFKLKGKQQQSKRLRGYCTDLKSTFIELQLHDQRVTASCGFVRLINPSPKATPWLLFEYD